MNEKLAEKLARCLLEMFLEPIYDSPFGKSSLPHLIFSEGLGSKQKKSANSDHKASFVCQQNPYALIQL